MRNKSFFDKYKIEVMFFPFFILYILLGFMVLGIGNNIWDKSIKKLKDRGL